MLDICFHADHRPMILRGYGYSIIYIHSGRYWSIGKIAAVFLKKSSFLQSFLSLFPRLVTSCLGEEGENILRSYDK